MGADAKIDLEKVRCLHAALDLSYLLKPCLCRTSSRFIAHHCPYTSPSSRRHAVLRSARRPLARRCRGRSNPWVRPRLPSPRSSRRSEADWGRYDTVARVYCQVLYCSLYRTCCLAVRVVCHLGSACLMLATSSRRGMYILVRPTKGATSRLDRSLRVCGSPGRPPTACWNLVELKCAMRVASVAIFVLRVHQAFSSHTAPHIFVSFPRRRRCLDRLTTILAPRLGSRLLLPSASSKHLSHIATIVAPAVTRTPPFEFHWFLGSSSVLSLLA